MRSLAAWLAIAVTMVVAFAHVASAADSPTAFHITGPATRVQLLELYTSEGCSSCPPADAWLARFEQDERLWDHTVPVAFHVDYWDSLGWRDRFALPANTARQRAHVRAGHAGGVYTPGFFVDGREWRGWFAREPLPGGTPTNVGSLQVDVRAGHVTVSTAAPELSRQARVLHVAVLGSGLATQVRRGENGGRTLRHAFVLLQHGEARFSAGRGEVRLPAWNREPVARRAIAVWVTSARDGTPLQAAGGWLPPAGA